MSWKFQTKFSLVWEKSLTKYSVLLRGLCGALLSRGLKALFLHLSRALLGILSGALLYHLIMADFTLNIAAMLWELHWTFKAGHIAISDDRCSFTFLQQTKLLPMKPYLLFAILATRRSDPLIFPKIFTNLSAHPCHNIHKICLQALFFQNIGLCKNFDIIIS